MPNGGQIFGNVFPSFAELFSQAADSTVGNSGAELSALGAGVGSLVIPANSLMAGTVLRIRAFGYMTCGVSTNLTFRLKYNGTVYIPAVFGITGIAAPVGMCFEAMSTVRSIGAGGTMIGNSSMQIASSGGGASLGSAVAAPVAIDTTAAQTMTLTAQWTAPDVLNTFTFTNLVVERMG